MSKTRGVSELVRQRREEFVLALIRLHELGGPIVDAELQVSIQGLGVVLRRLETLDELLIVEPQLERGFDHSMESPGRRHRCSGEQTRKESHHQVDFTAEGGQTHGGEQAGRKKEREKRFRPGCQERATAQHDPAHDEHEKRLVHGSPWRVKEDGGGAPSCSRQRGAADEQEAPAPVVGVGPCCGLVPADDQEPHRTDQQHVEQPHRNDRTGDDGPLRVGQQQGDDDGDDDPDVRILVEQARLCRLHLRPTIVSAHRRS
jgi:hypothetical protein